MYKILIISLLPLFLTAQVEQSLDFSDVFNKDSYERLVSTIQLNEKGGVLNLRNNKTHSLDSVIHTRGFSKSKTEFIFDESKETHINFDQNSLGWIPESYLIYKFTEQGQLVSRTYHSLFGADPNNLVLDGSNPLSNLSLIYDDLGRHVKTSFVQQSPESYREDTLIYHSNGRLTEILDYTQISGELTLIGQEIFSYSEEGILEYVVSNELFQPTSDFSYWGKSDSIAFTFNQAGLLEMKEQFLWREVNQEYIRYNHFGYEYNSEGRILGEYYSYNFDDLENEWDNIEKSKYEYSTEGNLVDFLHYFTRKFGLDLPEDDFVDNLFQVHFDHNDTILFDQVQFIQKPEPFSNDEPYINKVHNINIVVFRRIIDLLWNFDELESRFFYSKIPTSSVINLFQDDQFLILPNPTNECLSITGEFQKGMKFIVYDAAGKIVTKKVFESAEAKLMLDNLKPGQYFYSLNHRENIYSGSFTKL